MSNNLKVDIKLPNGTKTTTVIQPAQTVRIADKYSIAGLQSDKHFVFSQTTPSSSWTINHPLRKFPSVSVIDTANNVVIGSVTYISDNQIIINFVSPFSGKAYLN
jgi:hypothetical protein